MGKSPSHQPRNDPFKCHGCNKVFARKDWYDGHVRSCRSLHKKHEEEQEKEKSARNDEVSSLRRENDMLRMQVSDLQNEIKEAHRDHATELRDVMREGKTVNNTTNITLNLVENHFEALTGDILATSSEQMTWRHLRDGGGAMGHLALNTAFKGDMRVIVTDLARKRSIFKDANHSIVKDTKMCQLAQRWCASNMDKALAIYDGLEQEAKADGCTADEYNMRLAPYVTNLSHMRSAASGKDFDTPFVRRFANLMIEQKSTPGVDALAAKALGNATQEPQDRATDSALPSAIFNDEAHEPVFVMTDDHGALDANMLPATACALRRGRVMDDNCVTWPAVFVSFK
jgi:hypothetical protein